MAASVVSQGARNFVRIVLQVTPGKAFRFVCYQNFPNNIIFVRTVPEFSLVNNDFVASINKVH